MAFYRCTFHSIVLGRPMNFTMLLPDPIEYKMCPDGKARPSKYLEQKPKFKTVYWLHGKGENEWDTLLRSANIIDFAEKKQIAVVFPSSEGCQFVNGVTWDIADHIGKELVPVTRKLFPLSDRREDTYVAGISMGGYGALHTLFQFPELFCEGASLSGIVDAASRVREQRVPGHHNYLCLRNSFGETDAVEGGNDDLWCMVKRLKDEGRLPHFWLSTGTEDPLYHECQRFRNFLLDNGIDFTYSECPGVHNWDLFKGHVDDVMNLWFK
ncbi:MAG: alpha/beta hydrolase-fold protein [Clostridia bacterium]|nr:alpha/beta hydrolase-fold protein [Clostridia bacterium]